MSIRLLLLGVVVSTACATTAVPEIKDGSSLLFVGKDRVDQTHDAFKDLLARTETADEQTLRAELNALLFEGAKIRERVFAELPEEEIATLRAYAKARLDSLGPEIVELSEDLYATANVSGEPPRAGCSYCTPLWGGFCHRRCCIDKNEDGPTGTGLAAGEWNCVDCGQTCDVCP